MTCDRCHKPTHQEKYDHVLLQCFYENPAGPIREHELCEVCFRALTLWLAEGGRL